MDEQTVPSDDVQERWGHRPTPAGRTAVRHALARLLDELAPERAPARRPSRHDAVLELHRTPRGCILQGAGYAVSVSWFPAADTDLAHGELVVLVWRGTVSHPGSTRRATAGAVTQSALSLHPVEVSPREWRWQSADETVYDSETLAAHCRELLADEGLLAAPAVG